MGYVDSSAARPFFTQDLVSVLRTEKPATYFLQNQFERKAKSTLYLQWQVKRYGEYVANDVVRGSDGNRRQFNQFTDKVENPPYFYDYFDIMNLQGYNRAFGSDRLDESAYNDFLEEVKFHTMQLKYGIDRNYEKQAAAILQSGKFTSTANGSFDFKRKAASILPFDPSIDWTQPGINPKDVIEKLCIFIRTVGKAGGEFRLIFGASAYKAFMNNPNIQSESQKLWAVLTKPEMPKEEGDGSAYVGTISAGSWRLDCYTYPDGFYTATTEVPNTSVPYIADNAIIALPKSKNADDFVHGFAMVPQLPPEIPGASNMTSTIAGGFGGDGGPKQYYVREFIDLKRKAWYVAVESAGLIIPAAVDKIATAFVTPS